MSYSFMLQGQIDQILSTNAAGGGRRLLGSLFTRLRKEALSKLALVDANLARVTDVIEEVNRQIDR